jgi:hypothetical protein
VTVPVPGGPSATGDPLLDPELPLLDPELPLLDPELPLLVPSPGATLAQSRLEAPALACWHSLVLSHLGFTSSAVHT